MMSWWMCDRKLVDGCFRLQCNKCRVGDLVTTRKKVITMGMVFPTYRGNGDGEGPVVVSMIGVMTQLG